MYNLLGVTLCCMHAVFLSHTHDWLLDSLIARVFINTLSSILPILFLRTTGYGYRCGLSDCITLFIVHKMSIFTIIFMKTHPHWFGKEP